MTTLIMPTAKRTATPETSVRKKELKAFRAFGGLIRDKVMGFDDVKSEFGVRFQLVQLLSGLHYPIVLQ